MSGPEYAPGGEPKAVITQRGRLVHGVHVEFTSPLSWIGCSWGPNGGDAFVLGRRWARWKARRMLARFVLLQARLSNPEVIR